MAQRPPTQRVAAPSEVISNCIAGVNQYTDPTLTKPQQWAASSNVYAGLFGYVARARWATVAQAAQTATATLSSASSNSLTFPMTTTVTTTAPHGFVAGQQVIISGASTSFTFTLNGTWVITAVTSTTFTYFNPTVIFTGSGGGVTGGHASVGLIANNSPFTTFKLYSLPGLSGYLLADNANKLFSFDAGNSYFPIERIQPYVDPFSQGNARLAGPWSREVLGNIVYEMNGQVKQAGRLANAATIESFGLDTPDTSPQVTITSGQSFNITNIQRTNNIVTVTLSGSFTGSSKMVNVGITSGDGSFSGTFVPLSGYGTATMTWAQSGFNTALLTPTGTVTTQITKSIGRSYAWAWENVNKSHVGAPSPSTQFIAYAAQNGTILLSQQGTLSTTAGSTLVTGNGTAFTSAWVGRYLLIDGNNPSNVGQIASVASATSLTLVSGTIVGTNVNSVFQVFDPSATHVRLYATGDGGATYFRIQRNAFNPSGNGLAACGLQFIDSANSEPPAFPFTTETSQLYNIPPPVGAFLKEYQGTLIAYGVPGAPATFFYSNTTLTSVGLQQESYAPLNQVTLPIQNASINGMAEFPGSLIIWSDKQDMFRLTGLLTDNTSATASQQGASIAALPYNLGCASPFAVALTPLGVVWLTTNAEVWLYTDRYAPRNIGRSIVNILKNIPQAQLGKARMAYYHIFNRDWVALSVSNGNANNLLLLLDLEQLASNGSPSYFVFDMATNQPVWYIYNLPCGSLETMYEPGGAVRLLTTGGNDLVTDVDFSPINFGTETSVPGGTVQMHAWGNDSPQMIKRPTWLRFTTNRPPINLASDGWSFGVAGIDDDFYTFDSPLTLTLTPGVNDASTLGGNPSLLSGNPFRHSPELFKIGAVNFVMGRRLLFTVNFPATAGTDYQWRQLQIGFGPSPPR